MRLIDADALKAVFEEKSSEAVCGVELCKAIISRIDEAPTVDAVTLADIIEVEKERNYWNDLADSYEYTRKYREFRKEKETVNRNESV